MSDWRRDKFLSSVRTSHSLAASVVVCHRTMSRDNNPTLSPSLTVTVSPTTVTVSPTITNHSDGVIEGFTTEQFTVITTEKFTTADWGKRVDHWIFGLRLFSTGDSETTGHGHGLRSRSTGGDHRWTHRSGCFWGGLTGPVFLGGESTGHRTGPVFFVKKKYPVRPDRSTPVTRWSRLCLFPFRTVWD